jgi:hypothetical protein
VGCKLIVEGEGPERIEQPRVSAFRHADDQTPRLINREAATRPRTLRATNTRDHLRSETGYAR